jgi:hypothetical protein
MLGLTEAQRAAAADKLLDLANIAAGGMIFGQFLGDQPFSPGVAAFGLAWWLFLVANALALIREPK